jgi:murein L,D-transpeptidase YafK
MRASLVRTSLILSAFLLAACNGTLEDIAPKAEKRLPAGLVQSMKAKGMAVNAPIMLRIFKEEGQLEVWKQKDTGRYDLAATYEICKWSGKLGPKFTEGDRQAPEGFYTVRPAQMNPQSQYHLAFNIGYPNAFDRANGRTGSHLMVHGACSSAGCYSMSDEHVEHIYAFARDAFRGGQSEFQIQAFPFRMTPANMARYRDDANYSFWQMLKEGYDHFEITKVPPSVNVCDRRYVFNQIAEAGRSFEPTAACPPMMQPESLQTAFRTHQARFETAFTAAVGSGKPAPAPSIAGLKEAALVADWSRRRSRGESVSREPPSLEPIQTATIAPTPQPAPQAEPQPVQAAVQVPVPEAAPQETAVADQPAGQPVAAAPAEATTQSGFAVPDPLNLRRRIGGIGNLFGN